MNFFMPSSRAAREGQATEENTTVSSASRFTAIGGEVSFPSGTSSPQHSRTPALFAQLNDVDEVALRSEEAGDEPFLEALYASTRAGELSLVAWITADKAAFLRQQHPLRGLHYRLQHPGAEFLVIVDAGKPIGRLCVCRKKDEVLLVDVALMPEYRGCGSGGRLAREVLERAASEGRRVSAHVAHDNPARRLYERLGFRVVSGEGVHLTLECLTAPRASPGNQDAGTAEQHD